MYKKRIFVMGIKRDVEFCDQHHNHWTDNFSPK